MRNRLLNYRPSRARSIRVVDEIPREVYDLLVIGSHELEFRGQPGKATESEGEALFGEVGNDDERVSNLWTPQAEEALSPRHTDRYLETPMESEALLKRLFYVKQESDSILEEQGYSVLYLALGFLVWKESSAAVELRKAPLILVPVALERGRTRGFTKIQWTGEDIFPNVSVQAKLAEQGIVLPSFEMPEEKAGIDRFFEAVARSISPIEGWSVTADIFLDFFSFTKFIMYKDLDPEAWPAGTSPAQHPLVREILQPSGRPPDEGFSELDVDEKLKARDTYHIMDADSSQVAVIEDVKAGRNLVVEGPPGTGKSQTIANIIAEVLAAGKTVLFVSEKMAALDVVKGRLDSVGLGSFCLELHSRKSNKKQVLQELQRTLTSREAGFGTAEETYSQADSVREDLNSYVRALREPIGGLARSPFDLICLKERARVQFARKDREMSRVHLEKPEDWKNEDWNTARSSLRELGDALTLPDTEKARFWKGCDVGTILPSDEEVIRETLTACARSLRALHAALAKLEPITGVKVTPQLDRILEVLDAAAVVASAVVADRDVLLNDAWNRPNEQAEELIGRISACQVAFRSARDVFDAAAFEVDARSLLAEFRVESAKVLWFLRPRYWAIRRIVKDLHKTTRPSNAAEILGGLNRLADCARRKEEIRSADQLGRSLFGRLWLADESDVEALHRFASWVISFRRHIVAERLAARSVDVLCAGVSGDEIRVAAAEASEALKAVRSGFTALGNLLSPDYKLIRGNDIGEADLTDVAALFDLWSAVIPYLQRWSQLNALRKACLGSCAAPFVEELDSRRLAPEDAQACLEGDYADDLLKIAYASRPALGQFVGELHEKKIEHFMELDQEVILQNRKRLVQRLIESRPRIVGGASPSSEAGILLGEFNRKRGLMPIRKLMAKAGGLIQKIKPCFMMSPLSIAQFLDPRTARFDLIVFDEASQVRPEDALGALIRGHQIVVMGDTRQLPPTSFFDHLVSADDAEQEDDGSARVADVESILNQCARSFSSKTLNWHYRSRHESLIAVSNQEFYENRLLIYPSAVDKAKDLGLELVNLPSTVYDRGRSSMNRAEARTVAQAAVRHYQEHSDKSLGVGTFNRKQQLAILEEVELQIRKHPELESYFLSTRPEHFFVKNLETIQGDERDVIFLSIGFGFDVSGKLSLNFGPLNQEGGERRLNVLISRARERCVVFSNFRACDLGLEANSPFGLRALKVFLEYAETRSLKSEDVSREDTGSPFEDSVFEMLRSRGFEVRKQVGCAGFRVDLAIVDPKEPGRYLLGIECDGAKYHDAAVTRDRDRLRQQILERLGWRLHRVWSTDWYRNRIATEERLLGAIERARSLGPPVGPSSSPRAEPREDRAAPAVTTDLPAAALRVPDYCVCDHLGIPTRGELHEQPPFLLAKAVARVVEVEGPVHFEEVVRRVRSLWGLDRSGSRIRSVLQRAIIVAERGGEVARRGDFLWLRNQTDVSPRRRTVDPPPKIEFICDEEIAKAVFLVLKAQFATAADDLIIQTSRVFGIQATSSQAAGAIRKVVDGLLAKGMLSAQANGLLQRSD